MLHCRRLLRPQGVPRQVLVGLLGRASQGACRVPCSHAHNQSSALGRFSAQFRRRLTTSALESAPCVGERSRETEAAERSGNESSLEEEKMAGRTTPAMAQYARIKQQVPGYLLFFQMGDFFELFYEDAVKAAALLDITLTYRDKVNRVPMCGIPVHTVENYVEKLIKKGQMVALCEQTVASEGPALVGAAAPRGRGKRKQQGITGTAVGSGVVRREITRLVSPGTLLEEHLLQPRAHNYLAAVGLSGQRVDRQAQLGVSWTDLSTGDFHFSSSPSVEQLEADLQRLQPAEVLCPASLFSYIEAKQREKELLSTSSGEAMSVGGAPEAPLRDDGGLVVEAAGQTEDVSERIASVLARYRVTPLVDEHFGEEAAVSKLQSAYRVKDIASITGRMAQEELSASGALLHYIETTQRGALPNLSPPRRHTVDSILQIDAATHKSLEITETAGGERVKTLLWAVDRTVTGPGARLLTSQLLAPLVSPQHIEHRLDGVQFFYDNESVTEAVRMTLKLCFDAERSLQRLSMNKGGPRDLVAVKKTLEQVENVVQHLHEAETEPPSVVKSLIDDLLEQTDTRLELTEELDAALKEEPPLAVHSGGFVNEGYCADLDEAVGLRKNGQELVEGLRDKYRHSTGIPSLKVKTNLVMGMHVEVPSAHSKKVEDYNEEVVSQNIEKGRNNEDISEENSDFINDSEDDKQPLFMHCQSLASCVRYKTRELTDLDQRMQRAEHEVQQLELGIFQKLTKELLSHAALVKRVAFSLASLDVLASNSVLALERGYCRPVMDTGRATKIEFGRHCVVEALQHVRKDSHRSFTPNSTDLSESSSISLITGPNMGGKSTYLRQVAIQTIMAQSGMFVPAASASLGVVDKIFSRVGASDDLSNDQSTFMVEMVEMANILKRATPRSLVIIDEIGRGTSTMEGLAIAWAVLERLHAHTQCRVLFATHYHELAQLQESLPRMHCLRMGIKELSDGKVVFLHRVQEGVAEKSYGVHVARLAGIPQPVVQRAEELLEWLSSAQTKADLKRHEASVSSRHSAQGQGSQIELVEPEEEDTLEPTVAQGREDQDISEEHEHDSPELELYYDSIGGSSSSLQPFVETPELYSFHDTGHEMDVLQEEPCDVPEGNFDAPVTAGITLRDEDGMLHLKIDPSATSVEDALDFLWKMKAHFKQ